MYIKYFVVILYNNLYNEYRLYLFVILIGIICFLINLKLFNQLYGMKLLLEMLWMFYIEYVIYVCLKVILQ